MRWRQTGATATFCVRQQGLFKGMLNPGTPGAELRTVEGKGCAKTTAQKHCPSNVKMFRRIVGRMRSSSLPCRSTTSNTVPRVQRCGSNGAHCTLSLARALGCATRWMGTDTLSAATQRTSRFPRCHWKKDTITRLETFADTVLRKHQGQKMDRASDHWEVGL